MLNCFPCRKDKTRCPFQVLQGTPQSALHALLLWPGHLPNLPMGAALMKKVFCRQDAVSTETLIFVN
jgi:hypothetical protein